MRALGFERFFMENELRRHQAPQINCSCGIYAAKSAEQLARLGLRLHGIRGEVHLWGTIVEHSLGWRAQFAYPKSLVLSTYTVTRDVQEAKSRLATLTAYDADISLANGETDIRLWTKESGYHKKGLDALRAVADRPIETALRVAIFAGEEASLKFLQDEVGVAHTAEVAMGQAGYPLSAADPIFQLLREQRVRVVLVDLNSQRLKECLLAIRVTRAAAGDVAILAIGDPLNPKILDALDAGADNYFDCNRVREIIEFLQMYLWLINTGGAQWSKKSAMPGGWSMPPGGFSPPGGSTPPMASVWAPIHRGPRPMRPREVAVVI
jgi:hypothetical protein